MAPTAPAGIPIRAVVRQTGVSKELVHHYLRQGLLPGPIDGERGRYDQRHVRLLRLVRALRDDHSIPLEVIRRVFDAFAFDPDRIEALTRSESLRTRLARFFEHGHLLSPRTLSADEVADEAGVVRDRVDTYVEAGIVAPAEEGGEAPFSEYDARALALCEHGVALGVPFDSFRTIASHLRIGFDLEYVDFYGVDRAPEADVAGLAADLFVRREVAGAFVENVLHALTHRRARDVLRPPPTRDAALADVVYRPSEAFVRRHGLQAAVDGARGRLQREPGSPERWLAVAELLLHAGRDHEARFFVEEGLERWPGDPTLRACHGWALLLSGEADRAVRVVDGLAPDDAAVRARAALVHALATLRLAAEDGRPEAQLEHTVGIVARAEAALVAASEATGPQRREVPLLAGWALTAVPAVFRCLERGLAVLVAAAQAVEGDAADDGALPGHQDRLRIAAAWLLLDCLRRAPDAAATHDLPDPEVLRQRICRLDPGSSFARAVFLMDGPAPGGDPP